MCKQIVTKPSLGLSKIWEKPKFSLSRFKFLYIFQTFLMNLPVDMLDPTKKNTEEFKNILTNNIYFFLSNCAGARSDYLLYFLGSCLTNTQSHVLCFMQTAIDSKYFDCNLRSVVSFKQHCRAMNI